MELKIKHAKNVNYESIQFYLSDKQARKYLENILVKLEKEYMKTLDGNIRIIYNSLHPVLNNLITNRRIITECFNTFLDRYYKV